MRVERQKNNVFLTLLLKGFELVHLFIVNPISGAGQGVAKLIPDITQIMETRKQPYRIEVTQYPKHATELVRSICTPDEQWRVYACGGDGTLNEVVCGAVGLPNVAITSFPYGTGNDFVKCVGGAALFANLHTLIEAPAQEMDLITLGQDRYAINICSVGVDADVAAAVRRFKFLLPLGGKMPYNLALVDTVIRGIHRPYEVTVDGVRQDGDYAILTACNGQCYGGGFHACPDAKPDDGMLEFLLVKKVSRLKLGQVIGSYANGEYKQLSDFIQHVRGKSITIRAQKQVYINYDGEIYEDTGATFALSDQKIQFLVPNNGV